MKAGLVGPSYTMRSVNFDSQRTINFFPVMDETKEGKEVAALYNTPGLILFGTAGGGAIRGGIATANGRLFVVSGNMFYELSKTGVATSYGTVSTYSGFVSCAENGQQVFIATGTNGYVFKFSDSTFTKVTDVSFPGASYVTFQDGFFIATVPSSGKFYISASYDGLTWNALNFATAETSPDNLVAAFSAYGRLWLFGVKTTEIWYNSGDASFPYSLIPGGKMEVGCVAAATIAKADNSIFWVGQDENGRNIVYRAVGFAPQRISTEAIEYALAKAGDPTYLIGYCYQQEGHLFYVITGGALTTSFVYDASTKLWHERAHLNTTSGVYEQHLGIFHWFAFGKNLIGDRQSGNIYQYDLDTFTDNGDAIKRSRTFSHLFKEGERFRLNKLQVDFEGGVGLTTGQGKTPVAILRVSKDGGHTWSPEYQKPIGKIGQYPARCVWRRLGIQSQMTFEVSIADPVKAVICGAYFE